MLVWETAEQTMSGEAELEFARIWRPIPKVVFSPDAGFSGGQRAAGHRRHRRRGRPTRHPPGAGVVSIVGGAGLAAAAIAEDLIDEYRQFVNPIILGGGTPYFTPLAKPLGLRLTESLTFSAGVVYLRCQRTR